MPRPKRKKIPRPQFPPTLKLEGEDADGEWKVAITGVHFTSPDPPNDPPLPEYEDRPPELT